MGSRKSTVLRTAFDTYTLLTPRGAGPSGQVFDAQDSEGAPLAIKVLGAGMAGPQGLRPARDEFNFCFRSAHRNIVPVLDCGLTGSKAPFYVMPRYAQSLRGLIAQGIPPDNVLRLFGRILDGIEAAHLHHVAHRDLKPENILLNEDNRDLVVADFGIAVLLAAKHTASADAGAKEEQSIYSAPEQKAGPNTADGKVDVYALGVMLHEMFTRDATIGLGHLDIADVAPDFAYLDWTIGRMTNPEPSRRPSVAEVKRELIARGNEFLCIQRLNALKTEILLENEVDDPLLRHPITIHAVDFKGETLYLTLSAAPPAAWISAFHGVGSPSRLIGHGPERFVFLGKLAHLRITRNSDPQQLLDLAKAYVEAANRAYAEWAVATHREGLEREREKRRAQIAAEERRHEVLARLRL